MPKQFSIIGNFLQYFLTDFSDFEWRDRVPEVVCMVQKEVAERLSAPPGSKPMEF